MYYTQTELINRKILADRINIDTKRLLDLIESDRKSPQKARMYEGINYYNAQHDILKRIKYYYVEGEKRVDVTKANNKMIHAFHKINVNDKVAYTVGKPANITTPEPEIKDPDNLTPEEEKALKDSQDFQTYLLEILGDKFHNKLTNCVVGASNKGVEVLHPYINSRGEFRYIIVPAEEVILIYDTQYQDELIGAIRYYTYQFINDKGEKKELYKAEWWTDKQVEYWMQIEDGSFVLDNYYTVNPAGHFHKFNSLKKEDKQQHGWGRVPFIPIRNNLDSTTDLEPIKSLIDVYDKVSSDFCNDLEDFQELVYIIKGYNFLSSEAQKGMSELAIVLQNIKTHKVIPVDVDGAVSTLKAEIPYEAKTKFLEITRKEIIYQSEGVDMSMDKLGNNPTGVSLKFLYSALDKKANRLINELKVGLNELYWFATKYINMKYNKNYDSKGIVTTFNKSMIFNEKEIVEMLNMSAISKQTYLENHPYVDNAEEEMKRIEREQAESINNVDLDNIEDEDVDEESQ
ncbi:MAG: phage portal protein [Acholeplasmataceae bacterium]